MVEDRSASDTKTITTVVTTHRRPWMEKCQTLVPVISPIIAVLSFFSGTFFSAYQVKKSSLSAEDSEWRQSLQKATFNEADMIPSAFLLESFFKSPVYNYREQARALQLVMLDRTSQPEVFDLIFQNMLRDATSREVADLPSAQETISDILGVGATLDEHVNTIYESAFPSPAQRNQTHIDVFLKDPKPFFTDSADDKARLNRLLLLMWELDTFSNGMNCVWNTKDSDCPHLKMDIQGTSGVFLVNYPFPSSPKEPHFTSYSTCAVHHAMDGGYYCDEPSS